MLVSGAKAQRCLAPQGSSASIGGQSLLCQEGLGMGRGMLFPSPMLQGHAHAVPGTDEQLFLLLLPTPTLLIVHLPGDKSQGLGDAEGRKKG